MLIRRKRNKASIPAEQIGRLRPWNHRLLGRCQEVKLAIHLGGGAQAAECDRTTVVKNISLQRIDICKHLSE